MKTSHAKSSGRALGMTALLLLGTSAAQGHEPYLFLRTPAAALSARVDGNSVSGPDLQLDREGKTLRGRAFGRTVFLGLNGQELGGTVGSELTRMSFEDAEGVTRARGNFYGRLAELNLGPESLTGTVGRCGYELKATHEGTYVGSRSCGGVPERPVVLEIPPELTRQGTAMTLATLALILGTP